MGTRLTKTQEIKHEILITPNLQCSKLYPKVILHNVFFHQLSIIPATVRRELCGIPIEVAVSIGVPALVTVALDVGKAVHIIPRSTSPAAQCSGPTSGRQPRGRLVTAAHPLAGGRCMGRAVNSACFNPLP